MMRRYLVITIVMMLTEFGYASTLSATFQKMEKEEKAFLDTIKEAEASDKQEEKPLEATMPEINTTVSETPQEQKEIISTSESNSSEKNSTAERKNEDVAQKTILETKAKEALREKEAMLQEIKAKKDELEKAKAEKARIVKEQQEEAKRQVEVYEKQRAKKLAQEKNEKNSKIIIEKKPATPTDKTVKNTDKIEDINVTREAQEAKEVADKAYLEAVREMKKEE